jgi:phage terminase large subunit-like protein
VFDPSSPCPDPMDVQFSGVTLTDVTNGLTVTF